LSRVEGKSTAVEDNADRWLEPQTRHRGIDRDQEDGGDERQQQQPDGQRQAQEAMVQPAENRRQGQQEGQEIKRRAHASRRLRKPEPGLQRDRRRGILSQGAARRPRRTVGTP
jgi:hypothetical protein